MTLTLPQDITPNTRMNAGHIQENDLAIRDAINEAAGTVEIFTQAATMMDVSSPVTTESWVNHASRSQSTSTIVTQPWPAIFRISPPDHKVTNFTTKWRLYVTVGLGDVNPAMASFKVGMRQFSIMSGDAIPMDEQQHASITLNLNQVGLDSISGQSDPFEIADVDAGPFVLTITPGAAMPTDSVLTLSAHLRMWCE